MGAAKQLKTNSKISNEAALYGQLLFLQEVYNLFEVLAAAFLLSNFRVLLKPSMMRRPFLACCCVLLYLAVQAQKDPEFPKGWVLYMEVQQGLATNFTYSPDLYTGGLQLSPQVTIIEQKLRIGADAGLVYTNKQFSGTFGPKVTYKITTLNVKEFGSILNLQLEAAHLWGTNKQKLIGGAVKAEIGQLLLTGLTVYREYQFNYWWFQWGFGFNLAHKKKGPPVDPLQ
jgi:hypothetical protein